MISTAVILAAGRGSRLKEVTAARSKAMVPVAGLPMIARVIGVLEEAGIAHFMVVAGPHDSELVEFFRGRDNVRVFFQPEPKGSGDALLACAAGLPEKFLVSACDSLVSSDHVREVIQSLCGKEVDASLSLMQVPPEESLVARSVVRIEGQRVVEVIEKPRPDQRISDITALPIYGLSREIINDLHTIPLSPRGESELPAAIRSMITRGARVAGVMTRERIDLTDQSDLLSLNEIYLKRLSPTIQIDPGVVLPDSVSLVAPVLIESGVIVGEGSSLGPSVYLERGARVDAEASLERVVVLRNGVAGGRHYKAVITGT